MLRLLLLATVAAAQEQPKRSGGHQLGRIDQRAGVQRLQRSTILGASQRHPGRQLKIRVPPDYPDLAKRMNLKGTVQVLVLVRPDGTVRKVRVVGGHPLLGEAVVRAVMGWRYEPAAKESLETAKLDFSQN